MVSTNTGEAFRVTDLHVIIPCRCLCCTVPNQNQQANNQRSYADVQQHDWHLPHIFLQSAGRPVSGATLQQLVQQLQAFTVLA